MPDTATAIRAERLTKLYGNARGVLDLSFAVDERRGVRVPRPERRRQDDHDPSHPRPDPADPRPHRGLRRRPAPRRRRSRRRIGYLPGDLRLYERLTARELCTYFAHLRGLHRLGRAEEYAARLELPLDRPIGSLSKGNRQKVGLVQAFMHEPDLLVLDEPTAGLDPLIQQTFYALVADARSAGATVFLSSHVLPEVQHVADRVALIREGRLVLVASVDELRARAFARVEATFASAPPLGAFAQISGVREIDRHGKTVLFALQGEVDPLLKALARFRVLSLDSHEADLEDVFLSLYRGETRDAA